MAGFSIRKFGTSDGLPSLRVQAVAQESDGTIWIGTDAGLARYDTTGSLVYDASSGLTNSNILSIKIDSEDRKIVGTGFGLTIIDGNDIKKILPTVGQGSASISAVHGVDVDGVGEAWLATSSGLVEYNRKCDSLVPYSTVDGLIGFPCLQEYKRYRVLGDPIPSGGCDKALVTVIVNGEAKLDGYKIYLCRSENSEEFEAYIEFDAPLRSSDVVEACVRTGWRKVEDFDLDKKNNKDGLAFVKSERSLLNVYRKRFSAGTITLGGNQAPGAVNASVMYSVFVVPSSGSGAVVTSVSTPSGAVARTSIDKDIGLYPDGSDAIMTLPKNFIDGEHVSLPTSGATDSSDDYTQFIAAVDCVVYVAYDQRATALPSWLLDFEPVKAIARVTDMTVFEDPEDEKLMVAVGGTNGCVYEVISDPEICDVSDTIALDATPPEGCATIDTVNSLTNITLAIEATDSVTGVDAMRVSARPDFKDEDGNDLPWVPFQGSYNLELPATSATPIEDVTELPDGIITSGGEFVTFHKFGERILVATRTPGNVYELNAATFALTLLFETGEAGVTSLATFGDVLVVGTETNGKVFTWTQSSGLVELATGSTSVGAMITYANRVLVGTSPDAMIYQLQANGTLLPFLDLGAGGYSNVAVTSFAIFGSKLFISTMNDRVSTGRVLSTTTSKDHRHAVTVQSGAARLGDVNATTTMVSGHTHDVIDGVVQPGGSDSHTHELNGARSGNVYEYDLATNLTQICRADPDYEVTRLVSTTLSAADGLLFAGTSPNGKILRYVPKENIFVLSFDTLANRISSLKVVDTNVVATAGDDIFVFSGKRWEFVGSVDGDALDSVEVNDIIFVMRADKISIIRKKDLTPGTNNSLDIELCAYVAFRDAAGNVTSLRDGDGNAVECLNPCTTVTASGSDGGSGSGSGGGASNVPKFLTHRLVEIDPDAAVLFSVNGSEPFFSGNKIEEEVGLYYSEVINGTNNLVQWVSLGWDATTPTGTSLSIAVRSSNTSAGLRDAEWSEEFTTAAGNDITSIQGQFLQFRATLRVSQNGAPSPELHSVDISARIGQAVHYFTTNFTLPDELRDGILTYNGCVNPPLTDVVFGISGQDSTDFSEYFIITPNKVFHLPPEHQQKNLRVGIRLISSPDAVPVVDEFALLFSLANDAFIRLMLPGQPSGTSGAPVFQGGTRTVVTEQVMGHVHTVTFDGTITDKAQINGSTSTNSGHSHVIVNGVVQEAAGHTHSFDIE